MARIRKSKLEKTEDVEINKIRGMIRDILKDKYGGVAEFLASPKGVELGGRKIRPYLYDTGNVNFDVISSICEYLGIGTLTRKLVVTRTFSYQLQSNVSETK